MDFTTQRSLIRAIHPRGIQHETATTLRLSRSDIAFATTIITRDSNISRESGSQTLLPCSASYRALTALQTAFPSHFKAYRFIAATVEIEAGRPAWSAGYKEDRAGRVRLQTCFLRIRGPEWDEDIEPLGLPKLLMAGAEGGGMVPRPGGEVCFPLSEMDDEVLVVEDVCYRTVIACVKVELLVKTRAPFRLVRKSRRWGKMGVLDQQEFHQALRDMQGEMVAGDSDMVF